MSQASNVTHLEAEKLCFRQLSQDEWSHVEFEMEERFETHTVPDVSLPTLTPKKYIPASWASHSNLLLSSFGLIFFLPLVGYWLTNLFHQARLGEKNPSFAISEKQELSV